MKVDWKLYLLIGIGLVSVLFLFLLAEVQGCFYQQFSVLPVQIEAPEEKSTTTLMFVGDVVLDRGIEKTVEKSEAGFEFPFLKIKDYLNKADLLFGNLESIISDQGVQLRQTYPFRAEPAAMEGLKEAGFDVVSVANNHAWDYGETAFKDSLKNLEQADIDFVGGGLEDKAYSPVIKEVGDLKVAYLAYTNLIPKETAAKETEVGVAWLNEENLKQGIEQAKNKADLVVVSFHFGEEYQKEPSSEQKRFSHLAIDTGADLVVGHHPHVTQKVEQYQQGWIAYSLGNFVFDQGFSKETMEGLLLEVVVQEGQIKKVTPQRVTLNERFQPVLD